MGLAGATRSPACALTRRPRTPDDPPLAPSCYLVFEQGPAYPWTELVSARYFALAVAISAAIGALASVLACRQPLPTAPSSDGGCCRGRGLIITSRILASISFIGHAVATAGLVRTVAVGCSASAPLCAPMLPAWWAGSLLCLLGAVASAMLVAAQAPPAATVLPRIEHRMAAYLRGLSALTALYGLISTIVTATMHPFNRMPSVYVFSSLMLVTPAFGIAGASLLLHGRRRHLPHVGGAGGGASGGGGDGRDAIDLLRSRPALTFLGFNTFLVGTCTIGLPVTASGGYGTAITTYLIGGILSLADASLSLALLVLVAQATSADERLERAGLAMHALAPGGGEAGGEDGGEAGGDGMLKSALQASELRVDEMDRKMALLLQQQARLIEMLGTRASGASDASVTDVEGAPATLEAPGGGGAHSAGADEVKQPDGADGGATVV